MVRKRWAETDLDFFPGSNMLVRWVERSLTSPLQHTPSKGLVKFTSFTSSWQGFNWSLHLLSSCLRLFEGTQIVPSLPTVVWGAESYLHPVYMRKRSPDLKSSLVILNNNECLYIAIQRLLSALFIYLFILSISIEPFNYVKYGVCLFFFSFIDNRPEFTTSVICRENYMS